VCVCECLCCSLRIQVWIVFPISDSGCAYVSFLSLLLVYLKSLRTVSAGSPEVKPAEAHTLFSVCYVPGSRCDLWLHVTPLLLVHLSCHCHRLSWRFYGVHAVTLFFWLFSLLTVSVLSLKARPWKEYQIFGMPRIIKHLPTSTHGHTFPAWLTLIATRTALSKNSCKRRRTWNLTESWTCTKSFLVHIILEHRCVSTVFMFYMCLLFIASLQLLQMGQIMIHNGHFWY